MEQIKEKAKNVVKMLYEKAKYKRYEWHYYLNLILRSVTSFFVGVIIMAFLEAFGLGAALFGLVLCFLGAVLVSIS